jgi:hypothetical protein
MAATDEWNPIGLSNIPKCYKKLVDRRYAHRLELR